MKLATIALASAFALSSTVALAHSAHHKYRSSGKTYSTARNYGGYSRNYGSYGRYYGNPNDRGGLVGGNDPGTYKP
jgi:hypothetical protein